MAAGKWRCVFLTRAIKRGGSLNNSQEQKFEIKFLGAYNIKSSIFILVVQ